jgi:hypothetical protein
LAVCSYLRNKYRIDDDFIRSKHVVEASFIKKVHTNRLGAGIAQSV